jgi:hypothetical protein
MECLAVPDPGSGGCLLPGGRRRGALWVQVQEGGEALVEHSTVGWQGRLQPLMVDQAGLLFFPRLPAIRAHALLHAYPPRPLQRRCLQTGLRLTAPPTCQVSHLRSLCHGEFEPRGKAGQSKVPGGGFEPPWVSPLDFESSASAVPPSRPADASFYRFAARSIHREATQRPIDGIAAYPGRAHRLAGHGMIRSVLASGARQ